MEFSQVKKALFPVLLGCIVLMGGCNLLKENVDRVDLTKFRQKNQPELDSILRHAGKSVTLGVSDHASLVSKQVIHGLAGVMDTLDPDFQKLKSKIQEIGAMSDAELVKLGKQLNSQVSGLKDNITDEQLRNYLLGIIESSTGKLKKSTRSLLSDMIQEALDKFDAETAKKKMQILIDGAMSDSTRIKAQLLVNGALQPTVDSIMARIEKIVHKDVPFIQRQAKNLLLALGAIAALIIGWVWYQRRKYAKLIGLLAFQIHKMPSQEYYDELTKRIQNEAQRTALEPLLRDVLKEQGING